MIGWVRSCDNDKVAKSVLERMSAGSSCVLNDVMERLAPEGQEWLRLQTIAFDKFARGSLQWQSASQNIITFVHTNESWLFPELAKSFCSVHGCQRFVQPLAQFQARGSATSEAHGTSATLRKPWWRDSSIADGSSSAAPLAVNVSGPPCRDFAGTGHQMKRETPDLAGTMGSRASTTRTSEVGGRVVLRERHPRTSCRNG